jgi:threonine dehydratase
MVDVIAQTLEAEERIRSRIRQTPLEYSTHLSRVGHCRVYLKLENLQLTGSFKLRGALNKILSLDRGLLDRGVVTASSGNHAAAFAQACRESDVPGIIYLPENVARVKADALRAYSSELRFFGRDCVQAENRARAEAASRNQVYVSPYNDPQIIGGQGTVGLELEREGVTFDTLLAPVGGGGLISGVAGYLKGVSRVQQVIGCQPLHSAVMCASIKAGKILDIESKPTIADGSAGGIEAGSITFDLCRDLVDDFILVSEAEIRAAIRLILTEHHLLIEGAAALPVAALLKESERFRGREVVLVLSGAGIGIDTLKDILCSPVT